MKIFCITEYALVFEAERFLKRTYPKDDWAIITYDEFKKRPLTVLRMILGFKSLLLFMIGDIEVTKYQDVLKAFLFFAIAREKIIRDVQGRSFKVKGDVEGLFSFLKSKKIPSDIGADISSWSVISMPPFYRKRAITIYKDNLLTVKVLHPLDFIITKLRRFTDEDLEDALFVGKKFNLGDEDVRRVANKAVENSPVDTVLFIFKKNVELFIEKMNYTAYIV